MECSAITSHYEREFFEEMLGLNMIAPSMTSRVTDHVPIIIDFVQGIMDRGHAYVASDGIQNATVKLLISAVLNFRG